MPTVVIIGASSGLGLELVRQLAARGDKVYATCRKKEASADGVDHISAVSGDVTIVEGIDLTKDDVGQTLAAALPGVEIDTLFINAGSLNGVRGVPADQVMGEQKFEAVSMERMRAAFEVNTLGPLKIAQGVQGQVKSPGGKIAIMSTGLASIGDNGSGGTYAYRASKAAVNMVGKCLTVDMKPKEICVQLIAPGFVATEFGPGLEAMKTWGGAGVEESTKGCIDVLDAMTMESTGTFWSGNYGKGPKLLEW